jgi:hypothetical protein
MSSAIRRNTLTIVLLLIIFSPSVKSQIPTRNLFKKPENTGGLGAYTFIAGDTFFPELKYDTSKTTTYKTGSQDDPDPPPCASRNYSEFWEKVGCEFCVRAWFRTEFVTHVSLNADGSPFVHNYLLRGTRQSQAIELNRNSSQLLRDYLIRMLWDHGEAEISLTFDDSSRHLHSMPLWKVSWNTQERMKPSFKKTWLAPFCEEQKVIQKPKPRPGSDVFETQRAN